MSRPSDGARFATIILVVVLCIVGGVVGLYFKFRDQLDARDQVRTANQLFKDTKFIEAAAMYERALPNADDPLVHFNLGLAYSKMTRPGYEKPVKLGVVGDAVCASIPDVKTIEAQVCEDDGDRRYPECTEKDAQEICGKHACVKQTLCALDSPAIANLAAVHLEKWVAVQTSDNELLAQRKAAYAELAKLESSRDERIANGDKTAINDTDDIKKLKAEIKELETKPTIRALITQQWVDSDQHAKALDYWTALLAASPNDPEIMTNLANINLKANDWRKSIEWYLKVADVTTEVSGKVAAYNYIGNVAWNKLASKTLDAADSIELADRGISALQKAIELAPKSSALWSLQGAVFTQRALVQGPIWAASVDRASTQDLSGVSRVLAKEAKAAAQEQEKAPSPTAPAPSVSEGQGQKTGG
ncbi:MAG: tetratricopeptide repeat protein [Kofleriaceae bacterium]